MSNLSNPLLPAFTPARFASVDAALDRVFCCDALDLLRSLPDASVDCVVTSPPYFNLRSYLPDDDPRKPFEVGAEDTPQAFVARLVSVFREVRRVLADDGVIWVNMGDSYNSNRNNNQGTGLTGRKKQWAIEAEGIRGLPDATIPEKSLIGIPWRLAFGLQDDGWILRSDIVWSKPNPMPESVTDRPTKAHEYVFLLSKSLRYWYDADAIKETAVTDDLDSPRGSAALANPNAGRRKQDEVGKRQYTGFNERFFSQPRALTRNARSVWTISTQPTPFAHFATMPQKLVERCILAGCKPGGVVLDPFMGSGTVALVARRHGRHYLGCDLNPEYVALANSRLAQPYTLPLFGAGDTIGETA